MVLHSLRVSYENWMCEHRFLDLLALLARYPKTIDQIALFTSSTHPPLPLQELEHRVSLMKRRIACAKEAGYQCGINILATTGHHNEDLMNSLQGDYKRMTNWQGETCEGSFCFADTRYLAEYVEPAYQLLAQANPDFIWVDDDVRYGHMPIGYGCFCDICIELFNAQYKHDFIRETLAQSLEEQAYGLRKEWLDFNSLKIEKLMQVIRKAVETQSSSIALGFMTGTRFYEGFDFESWANALTDNGRIAGMWRPGGGHYSDFDQDGAFWKAEEIGRQNALLPSYIRIIQSEIENFPYQKISKSSRSTALEAILYMTAGCTGAAFNVLPGESREPIEIADPMLQAIAKTIPFTRKLADSLRNTHIQGVFPVWSRYMSLLGPHSPMQTDGNRLSAVSREVFRSGLPQAFNDQGASCYILSGDTPYALDQDEIRSILSRGVYMDAGAVRALDKLGWSEMVGFSATEAYPEDCREVYTDHPLNESFAGGIRNCRQAFFPGESTALDPVPGAEILSRAEDYHGNVVYPCAMGLFRNRLGGLVCAAGYYPFSLVSDSSKSKQLKRLFVQLSGNTLPGYLESFYRLHLTAHRDAHGRTFWTLYNRNPDIACSLSLALHTQARCIRVTSMDMAEERLTTEAINTAYRRVRLPDIKPWEFVLLQEE